MKPGYVWAKITREGGKSEWEIVLVMDGGKRFLVHGNGESEPISFAESWGREVEPFERRRAHRHVCMESNRGACLYRGYCLCECGARCGWEDGNKVPDGTIWFMVQPKEPK